MLETKCSAKLDFLLKETFISDSKILQETKEKARNLCDSLSVFERIIKKLQENIHQDNNNVFDE